MAVTGSQNPVPSITCVCAAPYTYHLNRRSHLHYRVPGVVPQQHQHTQRIRAAGRRGWSVIQHTTAASAAFFQCCCPASWIPNMAGVSASRKEPHTPRQETLLQLRTGLRAAKSGVRQVMIGCCRLPFLLLSRLVFFFLEGVFLAESTGRIVLSTRDGHYAS